MFSYLARPSPKTGYVVTRSRPYLLPLIDSVLDAVLYAVIDAVLFRERLTFANRVLGAGVEPAHLAAPGSISYLPVRN